MKQTEQYKCQSYVNDNGVLQDCTCGRCEKSLEELKIKRVKHKELSQQDDLYCMCGGTKLQESGFCKDCI